MDGNGRWAKKQGFIERTKGHEKGAEIVRNITTHAAKIGISTLTLYAFSTENWKRPKAEVEYLMKMLEKYLEKELATLLENSIKFQAIGDLTKLSDALQKKIEFTTDQTRNCSAMTQVLALNYGAKDEIVRAVNKLISSDQTVTEENISKTLDQQNEIDMLIRTGGEKRVSNFLLWQIAYSELFFTETLFPEFTTDEFDGMISEFATRTRRFGGL